MGKFCGTSASGTLRKQIPLRALQSLTGRRAQRSIVPTATEPTHTGSRQGLEMWWSQRCRAAAGSSGDRWFQCKSPSSASKRTQEEEGTSGAVEDANFRERAYETALQGSTSFGASGPVSGFSLRGG